MVLSQFLFDRLWSAGVRHVFGIPGDFALNLYQALQADGRFRLVRFSHEPAVGFAADGCARATNGLGVCCVTYGAGGLNMVNAVACAYAEESPLVVISGGPGRMERSRGILVHHEVKSFESQLNVYREVTAFAAVLDDPARAAGHIVAAIETAHTLKRPVYLEVPRDMVSAEIASDGTDAPVLQAADDGAVTEAVAEITARLRDARTPVLIVGVEIHRFQLRDAVLRLAEHLGVPVASSFLGRGVFPTRHPQFVGTYLGVASPASLRDIVENSDCVVLAGEHISDTSLGVPADRLTEQNLLRLVAHDVFIGHHRYARTPLGAVIERLLCSPGLPSRRPAFIAPTPQHEPGRARADDLTMAGVIAELNAFVDEHPEVPLVADTGDSLFASVEIRSNECIAPAYYATMGFAVPAALGIEVATRRRPLVLVGDGAFQMTGPEVAHAPALGCRPVVVVLNNGRWEMLQAFFPDAQYNTTPVWPFATLAESWGGRGYHVGSIGAFRAALRSAWEDASFSIVEVPIAQGDISPVLQRFVDAFKRKTY